MKGRGAGIECKDAGAEVAQGTSLSVRKKIAVEGIYFSVKKP